MRGLVVAWAVAWAVTLAVAPLSACGDDGGDASGTGADGADDASVSSDASAVSVVEDSVSYADAGPGDVEIEPGVTGRVTFDRVRVHFDLAGEDSRLDYDNISREPAAEVVVVLLSEATGATLGETTTDTEGRYAFTGDDAPTEPARVRAYSSMPSPDYAVHDNTAGDAVYALESQPVDAALGPIVDLHAASGWDGQRYEAGKRAAAPFAILDTMRRLARRFEEVSELELAPLRVGWSPANDKGSGDEADGHIGTTFWSNGRSTVFVLGDEDVDTDEYDEHILTHEWGHYLMDRMSRDDSLGGGHPDGASLDPRVAWSEGWSNALGAFLNEPGHGYGDTKGEGQRHGWSEDVEDNFEECGAPDEGVFYECVVQSIAFDLLDPMVDAAGDHGDAVQFGWAGAVDLITGPLVDDTSSLITLPTVLAMAKAARPEMASGIDQLSTLHGVDPVKDEFGSGQVSSDGGFSGNLPLYHQAEVDGAPVVVKLRGHDSPGSRDNRSDSNAYVAFRGHGKPVLVRTNTDVDVDLFVFDSGVELASEEGSSGQETAWIDTDDGVLYVAVVQSWHDVEQTFGCELTVTTASGGAAPRSVSPDRRHAKTGAPVRVTFDGGAGGAVEVRVQASRTLPELVVHAYTPGRRGPRTLLHRGPLAVDEELTFHVARPGVAERVAISARARGRVEVFATPGVRSLVPRRGLRGPVSDPRFGRVVLVP